MDVMTDAHSHDESRATGTDATAVDVPEDAQPLPIRDTMIRLGQALKLASLVEDGAMARDVIADGMVTVNGAVETRRGAQLHDGDVVEFNGEAVVIEAESAES